MLKFLFRLIFPDMAKEQLAVYSKKVLEINHLESEISALSDDELKSKTQVFKQRLSEGSSLDDVLVEAFAVVREASKRTLKMRHFDVQLIGGMVLHEGRIAEMKTGEGKTLMSTLPAYLNALTEKGVFVVTVNDYLAERDSQWMGAIFEFLGLTVGLIKSDMEPEARKNAYQADIVYGTNNEFGFDHLRDNLAWDKEQLCQTELNFAIIDEVDSILIDEARTPLIISGPVQDSTKKYKRVAEMVKNLKKETHFTLDEKHKNAVLTEEGVNRLEEVFKLPSLYSVENMDMAHMAVQCLRALYLFQKDVDYVVKNNEIMIVDEFTGRLMEGRRYSDGLHQAIEAVEKVKIREESQTMASITFQNYFRMFNKLSGMTGTALTEAVELENIYNLTVVQVPTHKPMIRQDSADIIYKNRLEKFKAIVAEVKNVHQTGQPVLLGTISIEVSEQLSVLLTQAGVKHHVLNAKHHKKEAEIIASAGQKGAVTIATNMAGRGTDIVLGEGVKELGGLMVIGAARHESRRIDNQLRGRSGRQGDAGFSRFYVSLEDDLMRLFGSDRIAKVMETLGMPDDMPIEHKMISRSIQKAQNKVEKYHFSIRKQILEYDDVMTKQRQTIYGIRRKILCNENLDSIVKEYISEFVAKSLPRNQVSEHVQACDEHFTQVFGITDLGPAITKACQSAGEEQKLVDRLMEVYLLRKSQPDPALYEEIVTRRTLLSTLDRKWMDHLHNMDVLREGIGLRAWGQKDPLIEYKKEAFDLFSDLLYSSYEEALLMMSRAVLVDSSTNQPVTLPVQKLDYHSSKSPQVAERPSAPIQQSDKRGRNEKVTLKNQKGETQVLKWKVAEPLLKEGWSLVS
ncbi:MAG: preprotein translocase subunit SecA [bacterium]